VAWNNINLQFGEILRKLREGRHMTQEEFAGLCGISRAYYGRIERGEHSATLELCQRISEATGLSFSELFADIV
jgi:transcriptional regulator with XRE-family HTH domain